MSAPHHQRKKKSWKLSRSLKNGKPGERTESMQNSSRHNQSLQHTFFSHSLQQYGRRNNYLTTRRKVSSWRFQRKEHWATVITGEQSSFCLSPERSWPSSTSLNQWTSDSDKSMQVFEKDEGSWTRSSLSVTSSNSALNGRGSCTSWMWLSTASTVKVYGAYSGHMDIWNSTTDRPCHQELLQPLQMQSGRNIESSFGVKTSVLDKDVPGRRCSSSWWLTGWCGKQHRIDHGASDEPSSRPLKISPMA